MNRRVWQLQSIGSQTVGHNPCNLTQHTHSTPHYNFGASLAAQQWRTWLPMQETQVWSCWVGKNPCGREWQLTPDSCLENPMDRGAWQATVHWVTRVRHNLSSKKQKQLQPYLFLSDILNKIRIYISINFLDTQWILAKINYSFNWAVNLLVGTGQKPKPILKYTLICLCLV